MGRGDRWVVAASIVLILDLACIVALALATMADAASAAAHESPTFAPSAKDRPVLETVQQVWQARTTGISEFDYDGVHYVISEFPKEYVDYSSWYVRMP